MLGLRQAINVRVLEVAKNRNTYFILRKHILLLQFFKIWEITQLQSQLKYILKLPNLSAFNINAS